jgi:hypothetical protein
LGGVNTPVPLITVWDKDSVMAVIIG